MTKLNKQINRDVFPPPEQHIYFFTSINNIVTSTRVEIYFKNHVLSVMFVMLKIKIHNAMKYDRINTYL